MRRGDRRAARKERCRTGIRASLHLSSATVESSGLGAATPDMSIFVIGRSHYLIAELKKVRDVTLGRRVTFNGMGRKRMGRQQSTRVDAPEG
jgi:hypothetical protein